MRKILFLLLASSFALFSQITSGKMTSGLKAGLDKSENDKILVWVFFTDKGKELNKMYQNPESIVTRESLKRRAKVLDKNSLINFDDLPVNQSYVQQVENLGMQVTQKTKWFNGVSGYATKEMLSKISGLPFVKQLDLVAKFKREPEVIELEKVSDISVQKQNPNSTYSLDYGTSITQLQQINVPALHDLGIKGQGVKIAMFDAGFDNLGHEAFSQMRIMAKWDFVNHDSVVANQADSGEGSHGTMTLSTIGGFKEGQLVGPAYMAEFYLAKTENTSSETPIEENNWIAAVEWADSLGVDIISSSLGYFGFDAAWSNYSYTWENMDGKTARVTLGALYAMRRGIVVCNSAGNEGSNTQHNTLIAPADADTIITAGAVTSTGARSSFSSIGPTADGRIKPDVMAMGSSVKTAAYYPYTTSYVNVNGTSFSCPLTAGVAALILCKNPSLTPVQVRDALRNTASQSQNPDNFMGYGIINALSAANYWPVSGVKNEPVSVNDYKLFQNYPNPFNPSTVIRFNVPEEAKIKLTLYNVLGSEIKTLFDGTVSAGSNEYILNGSDLTSGVYFVKMTSGKIQQTIKITLVK